MSIFKADKKWEATGLHQLFSDPDEHLYNMFESILFVNYFMLDSYEIYETGNNEGLEQRKRRFFLSSVIDTLRIVLYSDLKHDCITLISGPDQGKDSQASKISEIILCTDEANQVAFIFILENGAKIIDSRLTIYEDELSPLVTIYKYKMVTVPGIELLERWPNIDHLNKS